MRGVQCQRTLRCACELWTRHKRVVQVEGTLACERQANGLATIHARHTELYKGVEVSMVVQVV